MSVIYDPTGNGLIVGTSQRAADYVPNVHDLRASTQIHVGAGLSTVLPDMDFETYSEAGFYFDQDRGRWVSLAGPGKKGGLSVVGSVVYAQHPSTEVLSLAYNLKDGRGERMWLPGCPPPVDLFEHIVRGGRIEAFNAAFEYYIWLYVCQERMGWPALPMSALVDAMAKSRAFAYPGALKKAAAVSGADVQKQEHGQRLIKKFSVPRSPTKKDDRRRIRPEEDTTDGPLFYEYNIFDIRAEAAVSAHCPDLQPEEEEFWQHTMAMNARGVGVDLESVTSCIEIIEQAHARYNQELRQLTNGVVSAASESGKLKTWLAVAHNLQVSSLDEEHRARYLERQDLPAPARRAIEIVDLIGSAGVKKVYAMARMAARGGRLHELYVYHGAHTGRDTGRDVQPTNLVKAGVKLKWCGDVHCRRSYGQHLSNCPWCGASDTFSKSTGWRWEACDDVLAVIRTNSLDTVQHYYGDAQLSISGCIRGLLVAADGHDLICSDYSSIEAVVAAMLADEQWRIEAFRRGDDIYLRGASKITGISYEEYKQYHETHGEKHPDRQDYGKTSELGLQFGGWITAWRQFDDSDTFTDDQVKQNILAWRAASPNIVEMWGGQVRGKPWAPDRHELYGFEGAAIAAIQNPGATYRTHGIGFGVRGRDLFVQLPSGRFLTYHNARLVPSDRWPGQVSIIYEGWNSNPQRGPMGWIEINSYGGRLAENIIQATARDILRHAVNLLERANYPIVMRTYDEIISEVPHGYGTIEAFETLMATLPAWAAGWPIRAAGGWRGKRYRKD